jgi:hypothetical protein
VVVAIIAVLMSILLPTVARTTANVRCVGHTAAVAGRTEQSPPNPGVGARNKLHAAVQSSPRAAPIAACRTDPEIPARKRSRNLAAAGVDTSSFFTVSGMIPAADPVEWPIELPTASVREYWPVFVMMLFASWLYRARALRHGRPLRLLEQFLHTHLVFVQGAGLDVYDVINRRREATGKTSLEGTSNICPMREDVERYLVTLLMPFNVDAPAEARRITAAAANALRREIRDAINRGKARDTAALAGARAFVNTAKIELRKGITHSH